MYSGANKRYFDRGYFDKGKVINSRLTSLCGLMREWTDLSASHTPDWLGEADLTQI